MTESIARATATAGGAVAFAGSTVVIALVSLAFAGIPLVSALGYTAAVAVAVAVAAATTLLPALLGALGPRINSLRVQLGKTHPDDHQPHGWRALGGRRGQAALAISIVAAVAVLAVLAAPVLNLHLGVADVGAAPKDTQQRQAYDLLDRRLRRGPERPAADRRAAGLAGQARPEEPGPARRPAEADRPATAAGRGAGAAAGPGQAARPRRQQSKLDDAEEAGREPGHRPAPDQAVGRRGQGAGDQVGVAAGAGQEGRHRGVHRHRHHRAGRPQDRDHGAPPARHHDPGRGQGHRRDGLRGRPDRRLHRPGRPDLGQAAVDDRHRRRAQLHRAAAGVPLGADAAEGRRSPTCSRWPRPTAWSRSSSRRATAPR